ncbi:MAG: DUF4838 domain-containing protein [Victivallales bacterium]|nr:DUF4838 domain-containing protein [Victivallales bacterium]
MELSEYLHRITGAAFPIEESASNQPSADGKCIFIGWAAPNDDIPLASSERRIKSDGDSIYLYGNGIDGNVFAVYDFLEYFLDCHFYTVRGIERIPQKSSPNWTTLDKSIIPSFQAPYLFSGTWALAPEPLECFSRKARTFILHAGVTKIGPTYYHVPGKLIPPGEKFQKHTGVWKPYRISKGEGYFENHPEYFAMDLSGNRVHNRQLCYSNPELRKLFTAKLEQIVQEEYHGGPAFQRCDLNDNNGFEGKTICACPECMKLVKKYRSPAGPYWDYLLEVSRYYAENYPEITLVTTAYLSTERPPESIAQMPQNVLVEFCPLNKNYMKPYDHPSNQRIVQRLQQWNALKARLSVQLYPAVYPRFTSILPLVANLRQLAQNLRVCHQYGVKFIEAEQGHPWYNVNAFNEIRQYMLCKLFNDITLDENELIEDAMHELYGAAAPMMIHYWQELEELEAAEPTGLTWNGCGFGVFTYLTPKNLLRWSHDFDEMERLVADDAPRLNAVRDARVNLDENLLSVHDRLPALSELAPELLAERVRREVSRAFDERPRKSGVKDWTKFRDYVLNHRFANGIDYFLSLSQAPRPLPAPFTQVPPENLHRILPIRMIGSENSHIHHLQVDTDAPFGVALKSNRKDLERLRVIVTCFAEPSGDKFYGYLHDTREIPRAELETHVGHYRTYYIGSTRLWPQCYLSAHFLDQGGMFPIGQFFRADAPLIEYDLHLAVKLDAEGELWIGELILVPRHAPPRPQKIIPVSAAG